VHTQSRRQFLTRAAGAAALWALPTYWRTTGAKPRLQVASLSYYPRSSEKETRRLVEDWGKKNGVDATLSFMGVTESQVKATAAAMLGAGPDIMALAGFSAALYRPKLVACNDIMERLAQRYGSPTPMAEYTLKTDGEWVGAPVAAATYSASMVSRVSLMKKLCGVDVTALFPGAGGARDENRIREIWNYHGFLPMARRLHEAGVPFGAALSECEDAALWLYPLFRSFGSVPADEHGDITLDSDATREALAFVAELAALLPEGVAGWNDTSNNRNYLAGLSAVIQNSTTAWAVALRSAEQVAEDTWHHDVPQGPRGWYRGGMQVGWCLWKHARHRQAARELLEFLLEREQTYALIEASLGYSLPAFPAFYDAPFFAQAAPPRGTLYNYPPRGGEEIMMPGAPAPPRLAQLISIRKLIPVMCSKVASRVSDIEETVSWGMSQMERYRAEAAR